MCTIFGEPHYKTFDRVMILYQGVCKHLLVGQTSSYTGNNTFQVYMRNEYRNGHEDISFPKDVIIDLGDDHVEILRDSNSTAAVPVIVEVCTRKRSSPYQRLCDVNKRVSAIYEMHKCCRDVMKSCSKSSFLNIE